MNKLIYTNYLTPYRIDMFNYLAQCDDYTIIFRYDIFNKHPWDLSDYDIRFKYVFWNKISLKHKIALVFSHYDRVVLAGMSLGCLILFVLFSLRSATLYQWTEERKTPESIIRLVIRKIIYPRFDGFICASSMSKEYIIKNYAVQDDRVHVVLQNPGMPRFSEGKNVSIGVLNLLYVGVLEPYKNVEFLIHLVDKILREKNKKTTLTLVGDGSQRHNLEDLVSVLGLNSVIRFAGYVSDRTIVQSYYDSADIFVLASNETYGAVVMEAMSSGLPVLLSDEVGSSRDLVIDSQNGYIFQYDNMQSALDGVTEITEKYSLMSVNSLKIALKYSPKKLGKIFNDA